MKENRLKLGVLFNFRSVWMGGIIYIINLVKTLNYLADKDKPEIFCFYNKDLKRFLDEFHYPYIKFIELDSPPVLKGFVKSWLKRKNIFVDDLISEYDLDAIYPVRDFPVKNKTKAKVIAWYADLQHRFYPEFFTRGTLMHRAIRLHFILRNSSDLVVSSQAVKDDFLKLYDIRSDLKFSIYHFVSINDGFTHLDIDQLREKYNLKKDYYMISNQFHKHKNHRVLLLALAQLKKEGINIHFAFTGKFPSADDSPYLAELHQIIKDNKLDDNISMLGLIPRDEQLQIMNHCQGVIQPSLFEGWSTVIEDAISLQLPVIASDLAVNIEHLGDKGTFFSPHDVDGLVKILRDYPKREPEKAIYPSYEKRVKEGAETLLKIFVEQ